MLVKDPELVNRYKNILTLMVKHSINTNTNRKLNSDRRIFLIKGLYFWVTIPYLKDPYLFRIKLNSESIFLHEDGIRREKEELRYSPEHPVFACDDLTQIYQDNKNIILDKLKAHRRKRKKFQTIDLYDL